MTSYTARYYPPLVRPCFAFGIALLTILAGSQLALAQSAAEETYAAEFESVTNNCTKAQGFTLAKETLTLRRSDAKTDVVVAKLPRLSGTQRRGGKLKAATDITASDGRRQRLKLSGRITRGQLQLLLIAEFYNLDGSSQCSQSWNVRGQRAN